MRGLSILWFGDAVNRIGPTPVTFPPPPPPTPCFFFLLIYFIYLKGTIRERAGVGVGMKHELEIFHPLVHKWPQWPGLDNAGPRSPFWVSLVGVTVQGFGPSSATLSGMLAGSWIGSEAAGNLTSFPCVIPVLQAAAYPVTLQWWLSTLKV